MEPGTLYQLRNLIHRRNVKPNPKTDVNSSEDFVEVITIGHVLSADQLMECDVFNPSNTKAHNSFTFHCNLIKTLEEQKLKGVDGGTIF